MAHLKKKALLIAVQDNRVEGFPKLMHAQHDAEQLRCLLTEVFGYSKEDIVLMVDHKSIPRELWPTHHNIRKQIQLLVQGVSTRDHLFFYFSGHGHQLPCRHHTETDELDEAIYTCNGKAIIDNDLKKWLVDPLPRGCKLMALWDSCNSQTILDLDHYVCNEPPGGQRMRQRHGFSALPRFWRGRKDTPFARTAFTIAPHEVQGRSASRTSVSITALSAGSSPLRPLSKWIPFMEDIRRVLSPHPLYECSGKCPLPAEGDVKYAHVISLSACRDDEIAVDDYYNGTVTKFFIDHLRANPDATLGELLLAIRQRVEEITAAPRGWDKETRVISQLTTFSSGSRIRTEWTPQVTRRSTEINVNAVEEISRSAQLGAHGENENKYSQTPSYSSHYRLNLDELVDL